MHIEYWRGSCDVRFTQDVKHGKGTRPVTIVVPEEVLLELAGVLRMFPSGNERGHGMWHFERRVPIPCESCVRHPAYDGARWDPAPVAEPIAGGA